MAKRKVPEINAASMADIAFLLLIFFITTTQMNVDTGITRLLPPIQEEQQEVKIKERNVLSVLINKDDQLMVNLQISDLSELREKTLEFFKNEADDPNLPEKELVEVEFPVSPKFPDGKGQFMSSMGVVSLQNDRSTTYGKYLQVQDVLVSAINELRDEFCKENFGRPYNDLDEKITTDQEIIDGINKIYKMNISEAEPKNIGGKK
jgi:biopolymer transport protein ExbD